MFPDFQINGLGGKMNHLYIFSSLLVGVVSQIIVKYRMNIFGSLPDTVFDKVVFLIKALFDPFIMLSILLNLLAGILWMAAMSRFDISYAYPFMSISFPLILIISVYFFDESISVYKIVGLVLIIAGIIVTSRSA